MRLWLRTTAVIGFIAMTAACSRGGDDVEFEASGENPAREWTINTSVDADGQLVTEIIPSRGYDINLEYPWRLTIDEASQGMDDADVFDKTRARFVSATASEAGSTVEGELRFSVCNDATCLTPRETVTWQL